MSEHLKPPMEQERKFDFRFPKIESVQDLFNIGLEGLKLVRETKKLLIPEQSVNLIGGMEIYTLGYLSRMFGGLEGFKGKRIIEVAGGDVTPPLYVSFRATQTRILAGLGVEKVVLIDPVAKSENFTHFKNIDVFPAMVQDVPPLAQKFDVLVSTMFLGGPDWDKETKMQPLYTAGLLKAMARLSDVQVHVSANHELRLDALSSENLAKAGQNAVYNFDVSNKLGGAYNDVDDFIVIDNRTNK